MQNKEASKNPRVEIDTSAPFESVKEAASRFGGVGYWRRSSFQLQNGALDFDGDEQAALLESELIVKERETLDVLKELDSTKMLIEDLKSNLQAQVLEHLVQVNDSNVSDSAGEERKDHHLAEEPCSDPKSWCGSILEELQQAKLNLCRTTSDLVGIRASVDSLNKKLEEENSSLEKTRDRVALNSSTISSLEDELRLARLKLLKVKQAEIKTASEGGLDITKELQRLSCEAEQFKKIGEAAKSEALKAISEIEHTRTRIKTAEAKMIAARKLKEVARVAESVALSEIKALSSYSTGVTLTNEEFSTMACKSREAEEEAKSKVKAAMCMIDDAVASKSEILKRVDEATEEVKTSKIVLEEALGRVEAANKEKLVVEESLRKWRSDNGHRRRTLSNSTKFKNSCTKQHHRDSYLRDINVADDSAAVLKPTLSIGQILSRKLHVPDEDAANRNNLSANVLSRESKNAESYRRDDKENSSKQSFNKKKKFGFGRISHLLVKQNKKIDKAPDLR